VDRCGRAAGAVKIEETVLNTLYKLKKYGHSGGSLFRRFSIDQVDGINGTILLECVWELRKVDSRVNFVSTAPAAWLKRKRKHDLRQMMNIIFGLLPTGS
jgi:hypothetical protein